MPLRVGSAGPSEFRRPASEALGRCIGFCRRIGWLRDGTGMKRPAERGVPRTWRDLHPRGLGSHWYRSSLPLQALVVETRGVDRQASYCSRRVGSNQRVMPRRPLAPRGAAVAHVKSFTMVRKKEAPMLPPPSARQHQSLSSAPRYSLPPPLVRVDGIIPVAVNTTSIPHCPFGPPRASQRRICRPHPLI